MAAGTSTILMSVTRHWAPNAADPSLVIRLTTCEGGSDGGITGIGAGAGCAKANDESDSETAAAAATAAVRPRPDWRISSSQVCIAAFLNAVRRPTSGR